MHGENNTTVHQLHRQEGFWMKAAAWTFGLWALMLPITATFVMQAVGDVAQAQIEMTEKFAVYREQDQRMLAVLQANQASLIARIDRLERLILEDRDREQHRK